MVAQENELTKPLMKLEEFEKIEGLKKLKGTKANEIVNNYFRSIQCYEWEYSGKKYRKLPNFNWANADGSRNNNFLGQYCGVVPVHEIDLGWMKSRMVFVWYRGRIYWHDVSYQGYDRGHIYDINDPSKGGLKWVALKDCAPVLDLQTNRLI